MVIATAHPLPPSASAFRRALKRWRPRRIIGRGSVLYRGDRGAPAKSPHRRKQRGRKSRNRRPESFVSPAVRHGEYDLVGASQTRAGTDPQSNQLSVGRRLAAAFDNDAVPNIVEVGASSRRYAVRHQRPLFSSAARRARPRRFTSSASSRIEDFVIIRPSPPRKGRFGLVDRSQDLLAPPFALDA